MLTHDAEVHLVVNKGNVDQKARENEEGGIQVFDLRVLGYRCHHQEHGNEQYQVCNSDWNLKQVMIHFFSKKEFEKSAIDGCCMHF